MLKRSLIFIAAAALVLTTNARAEKTGARLIRQADELSTVWSSYKHAYIRDGRVIDPESGGITTSEGQGYALLRAVWENDKAAFDQLWRWTRAHLQVRKEDRLFSWKWKDRVLDANSAADADTDIALALVLAWNRFLDPEYRRHALEIVRDIWAREVWVAPSGEPFLTAGNWAPREERPTIHVAYLAPYAYEVFARLDPEHPWPKLVTSSYRILGWVFGEQKLRLPPELVYVDKSTGKLQLTRLDAPPPRFGYDAFPLYWRLALDAEWWGRRSQKRLRAQALAVHAQAWRERGKLELDGLEPPTLYATVHALALDSDPALAADLHARKLEPLWRQALSGRGQNYYLQNWLWFDRALEYEALPNFEEFLGFLRPFDLESFLASFPTALCAAMLALYLLSPLHATLRAGFLVSAAVVCGRYLHWRATSTLNFLEPVGPWISVLLLGAELYTFSTVLLLWLQVGVFGRPAGSEPPPLPVGFSPSVDVFVPIYSESLDILDRTLLAARAMRYPCFRIHVCDDSHRAEVRELALRRGAGYIEGPRRHAKAGNLNHALTLTSGELIAVFDTDHIPVTSFLAETVPAFVEPRIGIVQTPHHFYNEDIFQRAFHVGFRIPNEQDMFNHGIQGRRDTWGGSFFVGSGAVFRRQAMEEVGGFNLLSITEDIHTSQHLHARGWKSAFVDRDLAVGLTAENLASYIIQRRRWMLGCLQIFFRDNPLFRSGLSLRQRMGYFASLYYFFYPAARVVFWLTPLYYLFFHWHPLLADVSTLAAYLLPYMIALPLMSSRLLPGWPRFLWGTLYEVATCFALARSMFDLLIPKSLGFKVTPKGLTSDRRSFDLSSATPLLIATVLTMLAVAKGLSEFIIFGVEKEAYFFNLSWGLLNLFFLLGAVLLAWEKPQRRIDDRIRLALPIRLEAANGGDWAWTGETSDVSLSGVGLPVRLESPPSLRVWLGRERPLELRARPVTGRRRGRIGLEFERLTDEDRERLLLMTFADPRTWEHAHSRHTRSNFMMAAYFFYGLVRAVLPTRAPTPKPSLPAAAPATALLLAALMFASPAAHGNALTEAWYLSRARSNMKLGNYKAAVEAYEKVVQANPENADASRALGLAYEKSGLTDKAVSQFDAYLEKNPKDPEIAFKQAEILGWERYGYRRADALKYYRLGLATQNDVPMRLKYARLLASNRSELPEAIAQYQLVLKTQPANARAHAGLAKAYAWQGNPDLALRHSELAGKRAGGDAELTALDRKLSDPRAPVLSVGSTFSFQPGTDYGFTYFSLVPRLVFDPSPFVTLTLRAGFESYWHRSSFNTVENSAGALLSLGLRYRLDPSLHFDVRVGYHSFAPISTRASEASVSTVPANLLLAAELEREDPAVARALGFEREIVTDSFLSAAGSQLFGTGLGQARANSFYARLRATEGPLSFGLKPSVGWVSSLSTTDDFRLGLNAYAEYALSETWTLGDSQDLLHYGMDRSAISEDGGGYFSPAFYARNHPSVTGTFGLREKLVLKGAFGPTVQFVTDARKERAWELGAEGGLALSNDLGPRSSFELGAEFSQVGDLYSRILLRALVSWRL
jgi:cellulose synthase (UDP-forming)